MKRDHGGGIDAARALYGGARIAWVDLSTGINPVAYPATGLAPDAWTALPDAGALERLCDAARAFWQVPPDAAILAAPGASALIAQIPALRRPAQVHILTPTYNEHAAAFDAHGWTIGAATDASRGAEAQVVVNPNNPTNAYWRTDTLPLPRAALTVIDESFCDVAPERSLIHMASTPGTVVLKSFGKFWGLAGMRLGFAIGDPALIARLGTLLGPWAVSGPALHVGAKALGDNAWATQTRARLIQDSNRLDRMMQRAGAEITGGTTLFRLYMVDDAAQWQTRLARHHIWSRIFPYNPRWLRLGLPHPLHWPRLEAVLA